MVSRFCSSNAHILLQERMRPPCFSYLSTSNRARKLLISSFCLSVFSCVPFAVFIEARPRERYNRLLFLLTGQKILFIMRLSSFWQRKPLHTGMSTGSHYLICLSVCVRVCLTFVVCTDGEKSCTRQISTGLVSIEAGQYGLTRWTWFFVRRLEVVAVAGLMWVSWCVFRGAGFFRVFFPIFTFF